MSLLSAAEVRESPLYEQMLQTRLKMSPREREATQGKESAINWTFPHAPEREYSIWIDRELRENVVQPVNKFVLDNYLSWLEESKRDSIHWIDFTNRIHEEQREVMINDPAIHTDGIADAIRGMRTAVKRAFLTAAKILQVGKSVDDQNADEWDKYVKEATGVNLSLYNKNAQKFVQEWADLNHEYLNTLPDEYVNKISQIVSDGIANNLTKTVIAKNINDAGKKFRGMFTGDQRRSERIARDQVGKLNSTLARSRMSQAKVDIYKWSTAADERVRGTPGGKYPKSKFSHYIMDRKYKQVNNPRKISDNGIDWRNVQGREEPRHAGQAINCRCAMIPSFIKLKKAVDDEIQRRAA